MAIEISFTEEMQDPRTLFVMKDKEAAVEHALKFCESAGLEYNSRQMSAKTNSFGRSFKWYWTFPREVEGMWTGGSGRWVWSFAGIELSKVVLHTHIHPDDLNYLLMRMRGRPLEPLIEKEQDNEA